METSSSSPTLNTIIPSISNSETLLIDSRSYPEQSNTINSDNHTIIKSTDSSHFETASLVKSESETFRSQISEIDSFDDAALTGIGTQEIRGDSLERDKKLSDKDTNKDLSSIQTTLSMKKKFPKQENLHRVLNSSNCLDQAAVTINFLLRRLLCNIFEDSLFKNLLKNKIELKLKELSVRYYHTIERKFLFASCS